MPSTIKSSKNKIHYFHCLIVCVWGGGQMDITRSVLKSSAENSGFLIERCVKLSDKQYHENRNTCHFRSTLGNHSPTQLVNKVNKSKSTLKNQSG